MGAFCSLSHFFFEIRYKKVAFCEAIAVECHSANGTLTALCGCYTAMWLLYGNAAAKSFNVSISVAMNVRRSGVGNKVEWWSVILRWTL